MKDAPSRIFTWLTGESLGIGVAVTLALFGVGARVLLHLALRQADLRPFAFDPSRHPLPRFIGYGLEDFAVAGVAASVVLAVEALTRRWRHARLGVLPLAVAIVLAVGIVTSVHHRLLFSMHTGFTAEAFFEAIGPASIAESLAGALAIDLAILVAPVALLAGWLLADRKTRVLLWLTTVLVFAACLIGASNLPRKKKPKPAVREAPAWFLTQELAAYFAHPGVARDPVPFSALQRRTVAGIDPIFASRGVVAPIETSPLRVERADTPEDRPWNVVLVVLESTGQSYTEERTPSGEPLMPALDALRARALDLRLHRSTGNSSASALYSIFTGLYPLPGSGFFAMGSDVRAPTLRSLLPGIDEAFVVTPGRLSSFFPLGLLLNDGLTDITGYDELDDTYAKDGVKTARDELKVFAHFLERLERAAARRTPFFATYYTYAPHFPYADYGPALRPFPPKSRRQRYLNNLRMIDGLLAQIVARVQAPDLRDRTVLVVVGDHGEAFGQHAGNWAHSRDSFEENFRTPALFFQPALFPPGRFEIPTSHVDLVPTLLDALDAPHDPSRFQGESVLAGPLTRHRLFAWANEGRINAWSVTGLKTQVHDREGNCRLFDLRTDPSERAPFPCFAFPGEPAAIAAFRAHQLELVKRYALDPSILDPTKERR